MEIYRKDLDAVVSEGLITTQQAEAIWGRLEQREPNRPKFDLPHVAYYFGALIVISAMGWFMTEAWERFGGGGIFLISTLYALGFVLAGKTLWHDQNQRIPGGLLFTMAVCMTPLIVYGLERLTGIWPQGDPGGYSGFHIWVKGSWFLMELATIAAGLLALRFVRFTFLTAPIAFSLWYMSMDLTPLVFGRMDFTWDERLWVSLWFGLVMLLVAFGVDQRTKQDYAFWGYLFGMLAFWGGLSMMDSKDELSKFFYFLINLGLMFISVLLQRRVFIVLGSLGVFGYLAHLSHEIFKDSLLFPVALSLIGILVIYLGIQYQKNRPAIELFILDRIPAGLRRWLPAERSPW
jgi:hypothetical protein